jgi:putative sigma-54 modulation protein
LSGQRETKIRRIGRVGVRVQIDVTVRNSSVQESMREYAQKKAERLAKYYDRITAIRVLLDMDGLDFTCEMIADVERMHELVGKSKCGQMQEAIDQVADRMERQIHELKERIRNRKGRGPNPHQPSRSS